MLLNKLPNYHHQHSRHKPMTSQIHFVEESNVAGMR